MANPEHLEVLKQGVVVWNEWRKKNPDVQLNLRGADLSKANLLGAWLSEVDLSEADLSEAELGYANLSDADLSHADLTRAELAWAALTNANLCQADLKMANLSCANLNGANLNGSDLKWASLSAAELIGADLRGADLQEASFVYTNIERANLTGCLVYGASVWNITSGSAIQKGLVITPHDEPVVTVDDLEVAQFVYMLLKHEKLRKAIDTVTQKGVLLLGRFGGGGIELLRVIADRLRELGYLPIIFDFERPRDRRYTETIKTLAGLARFVIVDLSGPSVPQELYATVPHYKIPFVPILEKGRQPYSLFVDLLEEQNVLKPVVEFENEGELLANLQEKIVSPAEAYVTERQKLLAELFGRDNGN